MLEVRCDRADGVVMHVRAYTAVEAIGTARLGNCEGMLNLEVCTNIAGGSALPLVTLGSNMTGGMTRR